MPKMVEVRSSWIRAVGFDLAPGEATINARGRLFLVTKKSSKVYSWQRVPVRSFLAMLRAQSKGRAYHELVRGKYGR